MWGFVEMARATGLEPATSGVTGRHSNQLSYARVAFRSTAAAMAGVYGWAARVSTREGRSIAVSATIMHHDASETARQEGARAAVQATAFDSFGCDCAGGSGGSALGPDRALVGGDGLEPPTRCV
jgi:hypothetical protein